MADEQLNQRYTLWVTALMESPSCWGVVCRSYLPQASDRVWTDPMPQSKPTKVKLSDAKRTFN